MAKQTVDQLSAPTIPPRGKGARLLRKLLRQWELHLLALPVLIYFAVFEYSPMYGVQIAFKNFMASMGIWGSPWIGFDHFERFYNSFYFWRLFGNTLGIGVYELVVGFPLPILLALMLNEIRAAWFRKTVQTLTYAPHFLSTVVVVGMLTIFLAPDNGLINRILGLLGVESIAFLTEPSWFKTIYVLSEAWQSMGWNSIIYLAALTSVDPQQHEAAAIDGAGRLRRIWHINLPALAPTIVILLILNAGRVLSVGFEKVFLMQNALNMPASDVIATYVYRTGILGAQYSYSAAIGLLNAVVSFILLVTVNAAARRLNQTGLW